METKNKTEINNRRLKFEMLQHTPFAALLLAAVLLEQQRGTRERRAGVLNFSTVEDYLHHRHTNALQYKVWLISTTTNQAAVIAGESDH